MQTHRNVRFSYKFVQKSDLQYAAIVFVRKEIAHQLAEHLREIEYGEYTFGRFGSHVGYQRCERVGCAAIGSATGRSENHFCWQRIE